MIVVQDLEASTHKKWGCHNGKCGCNQEKRVEYGTSATKPSIITVQASNMRAYLTNKRLGVVNTSLGCDYRLAEKQKVNKLQIGLVKHISCRCNRSVDCKNTESSYLIPFYTQRGAIHHRTIHQTMWADWRVTAPQDLTVQVSNDYYEGKQWLKKNTSNIIKRSYIRI